jgi:hypothetical protein
MDKGANTPDAAETGQPGRTLRQIKNIITAPKIIQKKQKKANRTLLFYTDYGPQTTVTGSKKKGPNLRRSRPERGARRGSGTETPYPPIFGRQAFFPRERLRMSRKIATFAANKPYLHYGIRRNRLQNTARDEGNVGTR